MALPMNTQYQSSDTMPFPKLSAATFKNLNAGNTPAPAPAPAPAPMPSPTPAPILPTPAPQAPIQSPVPVGQSAAQSSATPEQKDEISQLLAQLNNKANETGAQQFVNQNQFEATRQGLVVNVFSDMMKQGIDPSKIDQVRDYLTELLTGYNRHRTLPDGIRPPLQFRCCLHRQYKHRNLFPLELFGTLSQVLQSVASKHRKANRILFLYRILRTLSSTELKLILCFHRLQL